MNIIMLIIMANKISVHDERAIIKFYTDCDNIESDEHINATFELLCLYLCEYEMAIDSHNKLCDMLKNGKYTKLSKDIIWYDRTICSKLNGVVEFVDILDNIIKSNRTIKELIKQITEMKQLIKNKYKYD